MVIPDAGTRRDTCCLKVPTTPRMHRDGNDRLVLTNVQDVAGRESPI